MAYGSPERTSDIEAYYTHIRRGRRPDPERLAELEAKYERIGGSPLNRITEEVAGKLEARLNAGTARAVFRTYVGMKHWRPYIADAVDRMASDGIREGVLLVLAPQYSRMSVAEYLKTARERGGERGVEFVEIESWHLEPGYIALMARRAREALNRFPDQGRSAYALFTAHSLPERILQWDDPYPRQLMETAAAVASQAGIARWRFAYQSASQTGEPWLGPDILDVLDELGRGGEKQVLVVPVGFVSDHLEILHDIDIEAKEKAESLGIELRRTESPNADDEFVGALAHVVRRSISRLSDSPIGAGGSGSAGRSGSGSGSENESASGGASGGEGGEHA